MSDNLSGARGMAHSSTRSLFRYWESIRGERSAPLRSDISLEPIRTLLPWIFIAERIGETASHRLRLAGTGICQLWGKNMTGKDLLTGWAAFERETMAKLLNITVKDRQPFVMRCRSRTEGGLLVNLEILGLPVEADASGEVQVLGLIVPFQEPELFRNDRLVSFNLVGIRIIWTEPLPKTGKAAGKGRPFLQLIPGGRRR